MRGSEQSALSAGVIMRRMLFVIAVFAAFAADNEDPWTKVRDLKIGTELRIIKAGAPAAVMAKFAELTEETSS